MGPHKDIQIIFCSQEQAAHKYTTKYKVPVPEELERKIKENLALFMRDKPHNVEMTLNITVKHDS